MVPHTQITTMADQRFTTTLELAVRFGKTLVVAEMEKVEPILYPLLRKDLDRQGPRFVVQVGHPAAPRLAASLLCRPLLCR